MWILSSPHFTDALSMNIHHYISAQIWDDEWLIFAFSRILPCPLAHNHWELCSLKLKELTNLDAFLQEPSFFPFFSYDHVPESGSWHPRLWNHFPWPGVQTCLSVSPIIAELLSEFCWSHPPSLTPFLGPAILLLMGLNIELFTVSCHLFAPLPYFSCDFFHIHSLVYLLWSSENRPIKVKMGPWCLVFMLWYRQYETFLKNNQMRSPGQWLHLCIFPTRSLLHKRNKLKLKKKKNYLPNPFAFERLYQFPFLGKK